MAVEATTEPVVEPAETTPQAVDTNNVSSQFKKEFAEANPDLFEGVNNVTELAEGLLAKQKALVLPNNPSEADLAAYREARGVPESADGYEFEESLGLGEEDISLVRRVAHENNSTAQEATTLASALAEKNKAFSESVESERTQMISETKEYLKKTYGESAEAKMNLAKSVVKRFGGEEHLKFLEESSLGNHKSHVEMMIKFAEAISEDTLDDGGSGPAPKKNDGMISFPNTPGME